MATFLVVEVGLDLYHNGSEISIGRDAFTSLRVSLLCLGMDHHKRSKNGFELGELVATIPTSRFDGLFPSGRAPGQVLLDDRSLAFVLHHLDRFEDNLLRQQLWGALYDMVSTKVRLSVVSL